jgi:hypothetical protein
MIAGVTEVSRGGYGMLFTASAVNAAINADTKEGQISALMSHYQMPKGVVYSMRALNTVGGVAGLGMNGASIHEGFMSDTLTRQEKEEKIISGSVGAAGSFMFLGAALCVTPATAPIGAVLLIGGTLCIIGQTLYDYRREMW